MCASGQNKTNRAVLGIVGTGDGIQIQHRLLAGSSHHLDRAAAAVAQRQAADRCRGRRAVVTHQLQSAASSINASSRAQLNRCIIGGVVECQNAFIHTHCGRAGQTAVIAFQRHRSRTELLNRTRSRQLGVHRATEEVEVSSDSYCPCAIHQRLEPGGPSAQVKTGRRNGEGVGVQHRHQWPCGVSEKNEVQSRRGTIGLIRIQVDRATAARVKTAACCRGTVEHPRAIEVENGRCPGHDGVVGDRADGAAQFQDAVVDADVIRAVGTRRDRPFSRA